MAVLIGRPVAPWSHPYWPPGFASKNHHRPSRSTAKSNAAYARPKLSRYLRVDRSIRSGTLTTRYVAVDAEQAEIARSAYRRYGKERHRAALNYGDCFSYALAVASGEPLLFKGDDFTQTDVAHVEL